MKQITQATHNGYAWLIDTNEVIDNVNTLVDFLIKHNRPHSFNNATKELFADHADCTAMDEFAEVYFSA